MRTAASAFHSWVEHAEAARTAKQAAVHAIAHWQHGVAAAAWNAWLARVESWQLKRSWVAVAEEHWKHALTAASFTAWRETRDAGLIAHQRMDKAVRFLRSARLAAGWRSWVATTQQKLVRLCAPHDRGMLSATAAGWTELDTQEKLVSASKWKAKAAYPTPFSGTPPRNTSRLPASGGCGWFPNVSARAACKQPAFIKSCMMAMLAEAAKAQPCVVCDAGIARESD